MFCFVKSIMRAPLVPWMMIPIIPIAVHRALASDDPSRPSNVPLPIDNGPVGYRATRTALRWHRFAQLVLASDHSRDISTIKSALAVSLLVRAQLHRQGPNSPALQRPDTIQRQRSSNSHPNKIDSLVACVFRAPSGHVVFDFVATCAKITSTGAATYTGGVGQSRTRCWRTGCGLTFAA